MQNNILKKVKAAGLMLSALGWIVFASAYPVLAQENSEDKKPAATEVKEHYLFTGATQSSTGGYVAVNPDGTPIYSNGEKVYYSSDQQPMNVRRLETNGASVYKPQTTGERLSSAFNYEMKMGEKALGNALGNLMTGNVIGAGSDVLGFVRNTVGDVLGAGIDLVRDGTNAIFDGVDYALDAISDVPLVGFISDYTLKPLAGVARFAANAAISVVDGVKNLLFGESNLECRQEKMDNIYKSGCYPCMVIKSLVSAFLNGVQFLEGVSKTAGAKILVLGFFLWIAFYIMQQLSSLKNIEPMAMINDILIMIFKVVGAFLVISVGYQIVVDYVIVPFLGWGIDFGTFALAATTKATGLDISGTQVHTSYLVTDGGILPAHLLNNLMTYVAAVDGTVTNHMKLGHMITCHATHHGAWDVLGILIPNIWIWLCGALIWFMGFMMTLSILYYLVDMSFKLGFALIALPIVTGLWPFGVTKDKFKDCVDIILESAGIFIFLALTTATGLVLVDCAIMAGMIADQPGTYPPETILQSIDRNQGILELYEAIEEGDNKKVSDTFMLWGSSFLLIAFAYLYAMKLIGSTKDYTSQFFSSMMAKVNPMHQKLVHATDIAKKKLVMEPLKFGKDVLKTQTKVGLQKFGNMLNQDDDKEDEDASEKAEKISKNLDKLKKGDYTQEESQQKASGADKAKSMANLEAKDGKNIQAEGKGKKDDGSNAATQAMEAAGDGLTEAGKQMEQAAKQIRQTGQQIDTAGTAGAVFTFGGSKAATTATRAGTESSAAALQAGALAMKTTGKILKKTAKVMKKVNKVAKKVQKVTKKASKTAQKAMKNIKNQMKNQQQGGSGAPDNQEDKNDMINGMASAATGGKNKK